jgi:hypothetical protein
MTEEVSNMDIQGTQSELIGYRAQSGYRFSFLCPITRRLIVGETGTGVRQLAALHLRALRRGILHDWDKNITHAEWLVASKEIHRQVRGL